MATEAEIRAEIEELGRLTEEQENILYNITPSRTSWVVRQRTCC